MKIVIAPNALKGSLTAHATAQAIAVGIHRVFPQAELIQVPVADGGDGMAEVLAEALGGEQISYQVCGPLCDLVNASLVHVVAQDLAIIEMASAAGLALLSEEQYNPLLTSTYGVGELLIAALDLGVKRIVLGIGGSATNDGGTGLASALGIVFYDKQGKALSGNGEQLGQIDKIDISALDPRFSEIDIQIVCDVDNPLLGPQGATAVFGPQKGADEAKRKVLEKGMTHYADILQATFGKDFRAIAGAGAAGGLGAGLLAFLNAELVPGAKLVLDLVKLPQLIEGADLVLTAEGQLDSQTAYGKAPAAVAQAAKEHNVPCIALAGQVDLDLGSLHAIGIDAAFSLCPGPVSLDQAMTHAAIYIAATTEQLMRSLVIQMPALKKR